MYIQRPRATRSRRRIMSSEDVNIAPEATDLLFEAEDVAELVAEVTGDVVEVTSEGDEVVFAIGEGEDAEEYTVVAEGDEEILRGEDDFAEIDEEEVLESCRVKGSRKPMKKGVEASRRTRTPARRVAASSRTRTARSGRTVRKVPSRRR